jgi:hypothetical protein
VLSYLALHLRVDGGVNGFLYRDRWSAHCVASWYLRRGIKQKCIIDPLCNLFGACGRMRDVNEENKRWARVRYCSQICTLDGVAL